MLVNKIYDISNTWLEKDDLILSSHENSNCQNLVVRQPETDQFGMWKCSHDQLDHFCVLPELLKFFWKKNFTSKEKSC